MITINGKEFKATVPKLQLSILCESIMEFGDPEFAYSYHVDVTVP